MTDEIIDGESFDDWLNTRPKARRKEIAKALAHRSALRIVPLLYRYENIVKLEYESLLLNTFHFHTILRNELNNGVKKSGSAAKYAKIQAATLGANMYSYNHVRENHFGFAPHTAAHLAMNNPIQALLCANEFAQETFQGDGKGISEFPNFPAVSRRDVSLQLWKATDNDAGSIAVRSLTLGELLRKDIWNGLNPPDWWVIERGRFARHFLSTNLRETNWQVWEKLYKFLVQGNEGFGKEYFSKFDSLISNIALGSADGVFNTEFWEREPKVVNADIALWVDEARLQDERQRAIGEGDTEALTDEDFRSNPASIQTMVRHGKVVLERDGSLTDLQTQTAEAATKDLADGLRQIAEEARLAQADPRAVAFLGQCATAIEAAVYDQTKLFESGRNQKALETYAAIVDAEWGSLLSSRYSGLVAQFAQTLMRFDAWRAFVATPVESGEPVDPAEMSNNVEAAVEALSKHEAAFSEAVLQRLRHLSNNFRLAVHRQQIDDAAHPSWMQVPEVLQSDVAVSLSNVLLSYGQNVLQHIGPKILDGAIAAVDKAAFWAGALLVTVSLGGTLVFLQKKYPSLFGTVIKTIKKVRAAIKEIEPE